MIKLILILSEIKVVGQVTPEEVIKLFKDVSSINIFDDENGKERYNKFVKIAVKYAEKYAKIRHDLAFISKIRENILTKEDLKSLYLELLKIK